MSSGQKSQRHDAGFWQNSSDFWPFTSFGEILSSIELITHDDSDDDDDNDDDNDDDDNVGNNVDDDDYEDDNINDKSNDGSDDNNDGNTGYNFKCLFVFQDSLLTFLRSEIELSTFSRNKLFLQFFIFGPSCLYFETKTFVACVKIQR